MEGAARERGAIPTPEPANGPPDAAALRAAFDAPQPYTVGIEDEVMLLDPDTLELAPVAQELLTRFGDGDPFKLELPAAQLEIVSPVSVEVEELGDALLRARRTAADHARGLATLATAGVHPFSSGIGELNRLPRYRHTLREYGAIATRQLVCALQVHVAVGDAAAALAVYNAARSYLPLLAALAANAPIYEGRDSGLASVRPKLSGLLPRQGVPPVLESWEVLAGAYRWGANAGAFSDPGTWWWELRPHPRYGTLEFRVPDAQSGICNATAIAAVIQALVVWLAERHHAGDRLHVDPTWRIEESSWSACRHGVAGTMADLRSGAQRSTSEALHELLEVLEPVARRLGSATALAHGRRLANRNGAIVQREVLREAGPRELMRWLVARFLEPSAG
jgi:glutamate---cysteine ligase / carboxylate-amine ligase